MKNIIKSSMILLLWQTSAQATEYHLLKAEKLDVEYSKLNPDNRDPYASQYTGSWGSRYALKWDVAVYHFVYWKNNVHVETINTTGQVKTVGWEYEVGIRVLPNIDAFGYHHSRHIMDENPQNSQGQLGSGNSYPLENSLGVRFKFILEGDK